MNEFNFRFRRSGQCRFNSRYITTQELFCCMSSGLRTKLFRFRLKLNLNMNGNGIISSSAVQPRIF